MAKVDELEVLIKANTAELKNSLKQTQSQVASFGQSLSKMGSGISAGAVALGGVISAVFMKVFQEIAQNMDKAVERLDTLNNFPKGMSNLGIGTDIASQSVNKLSEDLKGLPTSLSDAVSAVQRLTAVNNNLEYSTDAFLALNNAILAGGATAQIQSSAIEQLSQAYAKGKPDMMEWRTIMQAMPAQLSQVAKAMGTTSTALGEGLRDGSISMNDFMNTIMRLNNEGLNGFQSFSDQARNSTGGVATAMTNLKISIQRGIAEIMNAIGQTNISGFINGIASAIGTVANYVAAFVKILKQAFAWVHALFGGGGGSTNEAVKETSSGIQGMASAVGGVSDNLDKATGSAKKLKHQLAGFDEMNVLQEQTSGGGGGGSAGGGGGGGIDVGDYSWGEDFADNASKVDEIVEKIKAKFQELVDWFKTTPLGQLLEKHLATWIQSAQKWIPKILDKFKEFGQNVWKSLKPLGELVIKIFSDLWNSVIKMWDKYGDRIVDGFWQVIYSIGDILNALWTNIIAPVLDPIIEALTNVWNQYLAPVFDNFMNMIGNLWTTIQDIWNNNIYPFILGIIEAIRPIFDAIGNVIGGALEWIGKTIGGFIDGIIKAFNGIIDFIGGIFSGDWERVWQGICDFFGGIWDAIVSVLSGAIDAIVWLFQSLWELLKGILEAIGNLFSGLWDWIVNIFKGIGQWFADRWHDIQNAFSDVGRWIGEKFTQAKDGIVNVFKGIGQWFADRWNDIKNAFSGVASWFGGVFSNAWTNITKFFSGIGQWFRDRVNDIKNAFSNIWNIFSEIGRNIWEGIKNGLGNVAQKFLDIFRGAIDGIKSFLGINSPSKLFASFGGYVSEGFANGILDESDKVQSAFEEISQFTVPELGLNSDMSIGMSEDLEDLSQQPIQLLLQIDGESIPVSASRITNALNDQTFLNNQNLLTI